MEDVIVPKQNAKVATASRSPVDYNATEAASARTRSDEESLQLLHHREASSVTEQSDLSDALATPTNGNRENVHYSTATASAAAADESIVSMSAASMQRPPENPSTVTITLWSKRDGVLGRQDFLGTATIPMRDVEHPPGAVWLPLDDTAVSNVPATDPQGRERGEHAGEGITGAPVNLSYPSPEGETATKPSGSTWTRGIFKSIRGSRPKGLRKDSGPKRAQEPTGSVHLWLGKASRRSAHGQFPGKGRVMLRVHAGSGLRKVSTGRRRRLAFDLYVRSVRSKQDQMSWP